MTERVIIIILCFFFLGASALGIIWGGLDLITAYMKRRPYDDPSIGLVFLGGLFLILGLVFLFII